MPGRGHSSRHVISHCLLTCCVCVPSLHFLSGRGLAGVMEEKDVEAEIARRMPLLKQIGPSCGSTCLSMCLEYLGLPLNPCLIEERIHPYGTLDLGELPSTLARFARQLGFRAQHYNHGTMEHLAEHLRNGHAVILMLNYRKGTGHLVNLIGVERHNGDIVQLRIRNPWGFDERIEASEFLQEWHCMRQSRRSSIGCCFPVFDAAYAVVAAPDADSAANPLPAIGVSDWLHSASVDLLVHSANGLGGSFSTILGGHWLFGLGQFLGNLLGTLGGFGAYVLGNLLGLNMEFKGRELRGARASLQQASSVFRLASLLQVAGWCCSMMGGVLAACVRLITIPLVLPGELCAARDALRVQGRSASNSDTEKSRALRIGW